VIDSSTRDYVYLSAADGQTENLLGHRALEDRLILNLLFQRGIAIPDNAMFGSDGLQHHLASYSDGESPIEVGLSLGIVAPVVRRPGTSAFRMPSWRSGHMGYRDSCRRPSRWRLDWTG